MGSHLRGGRIYPSSFLVCAISFQKSAIHLWQCSSCKGGIPCKTISNLQDVLPHGRASFFAKTCNIRRKILHSLLLSFPYSKKGAYLCQGKRRIETSARPRSGSRMNSIPTARTSKKNSCITLKAFRERPSTAVPTTPPRVHSGPSSTRTSSALA